MMDTPRIRHMQTADMEAVREVARVTWADAYRGIVPEHVQAEFLARAYSDAALTQRMQRGTFLVVDEERCILGFANFFPRSEAEAELAAIYVLPDAQGGGIGSALLDAGLRALAPLSSLTLRVERENVPARRFYEAKGFRPVRDITQEFAGHTFRMVEMELAITGTEQVYNSRPASTDQQ